MAGGIDTNEVTLAFCPIVKIYMKNELQNINVNRKKFFFGW